MNKIKPIRVCEIVGKWYGGGVEATLMNYYRNIDRKLIQFDFICDEDSTNIPYEEIESLGGKVILCPPYQKLFQYVRALKKIYKDNKYTIVHSNINALSVFPLYAAKKVGVPTRIAHSHSTSNKKEWKKNVVKNILRIFSKMYATDYFACTDHAGRWLFGNKALKEGKITIINNGIDINKYLYNEKTRENIRKELGLKDYNIVIGHVGRFVKQKNHNYLINIFNELHKSNGNYKLMLVGQGPLLKDIKDKIDELNLTDAVLLIGQKENVNDYYQAMDIFVFPSLYEGLGMVTIEAQTSGLQCIVSTEIPKIAKVSDNIIFLDLNKPIEEWVNAIKQTVISNRTIDIERISNAGYNIDKESKKMQDKLIEIEGNGNENKK